MAREEIRPLTGVRGVAAMLVAVYHLNGPHEAALLRLPGPAGVAVAHGYLAVDLFFVLSGFVIALSYGEMLRSFSMGAYARFLVRRLARVYPLYIAITLLIAAMLALGISHEPVEHFGSTLLWNVLLVQSWGLAPSLDIPGWSISTEWAAYLLFPLLAAACLFRRPRAAAIATFASALTIVVLATATSLQPDRTGPLDIYVPGLTVFRCLAGFTLGLVTYRAAQSAAVRRRAAHPALGVSLAAAILVLLAVPDSDVALVALFPPLVLTLAVGTGPVQRFFASPPIFLAGELSYAVYLLHTRFQRGRDVLLAKLHPLLGPAAPAIASLIIYALLLLAAWAAYRGLERPARGWVRRAERFIPSRPASAPGSPTQAPVPGAAAP